MNKKTVLAILLALLTACSGGKRHRPELPPRSKNSATATSPSRPDRKTTRTRPTPQGNAPTQSHQTTTTATTTTTTTTDKRKYSGPELFEMRNPAVFTIYTSTADASYQGSGFFVGRHTAVSNYHVFKGTGRGREQIKLHDGTICKVSRVIAYSDSDDYIVFEVQHTCESYIPLATDRPKVGEKCYTIGSPMGLENTFSSGEISQLRGHDYIQISAPIDHGSSGGALLNERGEAIGITSAGLDDSGANLNFAISIDLVRPYI